MLSMRTSSRAFILALTLAAVSPLAIADGTAAPMATAPAATTAPSSASPAQTQATTQTSAPTQLTEAEYAARQAAAEKTLRRIRFEHFSKVKPETRKAGIAKLAEFTDGPSFAAMLEVLRGEQDDVRRAMIDQMGAVKSDAAVTTLAFAAINEQDSALRAMAREKLNSVVRASGKRPAGVDTAIINALERGKVAPTAAGAAARVVQSLGILEAIPTLIQAQVAGGSGGQDSAGTAISWIMIGNQRAYVADLTPVVGDGAVGFDPTPGVINEGVVLAIGDAAVTTYHSEVHQVLVEMTSNLAGKDTSPMGYNQARWAQWYHTDFPVILAQREARKQAEQKERAREAAARAAEAKKANDAKKAAERKTAPSTKPAAPDVGEPAKPAGKSGKQVDTRPVKPSVEVRRSRGT